MFWTPLNCQHVLLTPNKLLAVCLPKLEANWFFSQVVPRTSQHQAATIQPKHPNRKRSASHGLVSQFRQSNSIVEHLTGDKQDRIHGLVGVNRDGEIHVNLEMMIFWSFLWQGYVLCWTDLDINWPNLNQKPNRMTTKEKTQSEHSIKLSAKSQATSPTHKDVWRPKKHLRLFLAMVFSLILTSTTHLLHEVWLWLLKFTLPETNTT